MIADTSTLLDEVRRAFAATPTGRELGLLDAEIVDTTLRITFKGAPDDDGVVWLVLDDGD